MILKKCLDQDYVSFKDFFADEFGDPEGILSKRVKSDGELVEYLESKNDNIILFGCTSHERICIIDGEYTDNECYLTINSTGYDDKYSLQFLLPSKIIGWENAWVYVTVEGKDELYLKIIDILNIRAN